MHRGQEKPKLVYGVTPFSDVSLCFACVWHILNDLYAEYGIHLVYPHVCVVYTLRCICCVLKVHVLAYKVYINDASYVAHVSIFHPFLYPIVFARWSPGPT